MAFVTFLCNIFVIICNKYEIYAYNLKDLCNKVIAETKYIFHLEHIGSENAVLQMCRYISEYGHRVKEEYMRYNRNRRFYMSLCAAISATVLTGFAGISTETMAGQEAETQMSAENVQEASEVEVETVVSETEDANVEKMFEDTMAMSEMEMEASIQQLAAEKQAEAEEQRIIAEMAAKEEQRIAEEKAAAEAEAARAAAAEYEKKLLAALIFCEAGNQPYDGQVGVGAVVMNRVKSSVYPNSITEVIYQAGQFGPAITGWLDSVLARGGYTESAMRAAEDALAGASPVGDCLYFGNGNWGLKIGDHYFH